MNKNEFIELTAYCSGTIRYVNINLICYYIKEDDKTKVDLLSGKWFYVRETCEQIKKLINEAVSK